MAASTVTGESKRTGSDGTSRRRVVRVTRLGSHRAGGQLGPWYLGALGLAVAAVLAAGTALEGRAPPATGSPSQTGWTQSQPGGPAAADGTPPTAYVFPVASGDVTYERTHHDYPATDIIAACGAPVLAVTDGTVL